MPPQQPLVFRQQDPALARKLRMVDALRKQSSGIKDIRHPLQGFAQLAQALAANKLEGEAKTLEDTNRTQTIADLQSAFAAGRGTPGTPGIAPTAGADIGDTPSIAGTPGTPAVPGSLQAMIAALSGAQNPVLQERGLLAGIQSVSAQEDRARAAALRETARTEKVEDLTTKFERDKVIAGIKRAGNLSDARAKSLFNGFLDFQAENEKRRAKGLTPFPVPARFKDVAAQSVAPSAAVTAPTAQIVGDVSQATAPQAGGLPPIPQVPVPEGVQPRGIRDPNVIAEASAVKKVAEMSAKKRTGLVSSLPGTLTGAIDTVSVVDQFLNHPSFSDLIGFPDSSPSGAISGTFAKITGSGFPGTDAASGMALLNQIKGKAFMGAFQSLKGGGQITEREGQAATEAATRLGASGMKEDDFRKAALEFRDQSLDLVRKSITEAKALGIDTSAQDAELAKLDASRAALESGSSTGPVTNLLPPVDASPRTDAPILAPGGVVPGPVGDDGLTDAEREELRALKSRFGR